MRVLRRHRSPSASSTATVVLTISLVLAPLLASRDVVAVAEALAPAAAAADRRRRVDCDRRLFGSAGDSVVPPSRDRDNGRDRDGDGGPWWSRMRVGRRGGAAAAVAPRPRGRRRRRRADVVVLPDDDDDDDVPESEGRRRLLPLSLLLLAPRTRPRRGIATNRVFAAAAGPGAPTTRPIAVGAALSSLPAAMARLFQFRAGRIGVVGERGGRAKARSTRTVASSSPLASSTALSFRGGGPSAINAPPELEGPSYYVVETPLFPVILPGTVAGRTTLEISVAERTTTSAVVTRDVAIVDDDAPSPHMLRAVTRPLLSRDLVTSNALTGRELFQPGGMEMLARTGLEMCSWESRHVRWVGERRADRFVEDHRRPSRPGDAGGGSRGWYEALDSSQEVLVWVGKFLASETSSSSSSSSDAEVEYYGAELPIIKTVSVIRRSPKYLTELLMDSSRVRVYNKMSLGRTDVRVFQRGIDTVGGPFGDGESKVVRNLTKPPLVSGIVEFVTFMHARRLRPGDARVLCPAGNDAREGEEEGYIVVSRAIIDGGGGGSSPSTSDGDHINGEKLVRNEILLGVNVLRAVPGEPDKTELTSVTHVYSPMIPLMLAKGAGVKGATDFVRDIRALP